jgi:uncharacterized protein YbcC (UPF0753/DUF2309 family)
MSAQALAVRLPEASQPVPDIDTAIAQACGRIAPLWPLKTFVAVNPFLGFTGQTFAETCGHMRRIGANMLMPRGFYRAAVTQGMISDEDLIDALRETGAAPDVSAFRTAMAQDPASTRPSASVATVADVLDRLARGNRDVSRTAFMVDEISTWCAAYFDEGQAAWKMPVRDLKPYPAWRATMRYDRNPEVMGITGFRAILRDIPEDPVAAIATVVRALGIPDAVIADYLHRALFDIRGWAGYVRYLVWENALYGRADDRLVHLLAIRVVWGYVLFLQRRDEGFKSAWAAAMAEAARTGTDDAAQADTDLKIDLTLQLAYERAYRRKLVTQLAPAAEPRSIARTRPAVQAAFCIDVRSEVFRRALETTDAGIETIGFAGFFGFPIEYVPIGQQRGGAQCPVLLKPAFVVCEAVTDASAEEETEVLGLRLLRRRVAKAWKAFKLSAVSSFTFVETIGPMFAAKLLGDTIGVTRPVPHPHLDGLDASVVKRVGPRLDPQIVGGRAVGFTPDQRVTMAEAVLRGMSLTDGFGRLVLLTGHGSTTVNNPHAAGLDCGACGGHTGEANARVAAGILNDPAVRDGLAARGINIPADCWFLGALHDTTTDDVRIFDLDRMPAAFAGDLARLRDHLGRAAALARAERAASLGIPAEFTSAPAVARAVKARSRDWSQVRPEWGLAGNAAFIAAPRHRTQHIDLKGRAFLHSYDWRQDAGFKVLELIMTAPMVVANWINLQYYGSTVNNVAFGAGNKVLHNVVGTLGVLQGQRGDLQCGLPSQSVHDGDRFVHQPLRLNVFLEAPRAEIEAIISRHAAVRDLVQNAWLHLFAIADDGTISQRWPDGQWEAAAG